MKLFGKKKTEKTQPCCCGEGYDSKPAAHAESESSTSKVKVLGSGCAKCKALAEAAYEALSELNMDTAIDHVTDFSQIAAYGVMSTPALVIDEKVVSYGKVLKKEEIKFLLQKAQG